MNRGSAGIVVDEFMQGFASMRPRFMNRGSRPVATGINRGAPGFNEAPIHESGK